MVIVPLGQQVDWAVDRPTEI